MNSKGFFTWIFAGGLLFLTGCGHKKDHENDPQTVFRYNQHSGIPSMDPAFSRDQATMWATNQVFDGLVQVNEKLEVIPSVAKAWDISEDGLTYSFTLKDDVFFHDNELFENGKGRRVVAEDFVYSFQRLLSDEVASTGSWLFRGRVQEETPFRALNDTTFTIHLIRPFRPMLGMLTLQYCSVVPREVVDHYGKEFRKHPVGCGPFRLRVWKENEFMVLEKNPNYHEKGDHGPLPYLDAVKITFIADRGVEFNKFEMGELDFISGIDPAFKDRIIGPQGKLLPAFDGKAVMQKMPYLNTEYMGISQGKQSVDALRSREVRQALNYAIDRKRMIEYLRNNIGRPAGAGIIPPGLPSFDSVRVKGYSYDPDKAALLLAEAGYPGGEGLGEIVLHTNSGYLEITTFVAKAFENIGLDVKIENVPAGFQRELMRKNELDVFRASWIGDYPDGENYLSLFYGGNDAPPNYTFFRNPEYDDLYLRAVSSADPVEYLELYHRMEDIIIREAPVIFLYYDEVVRFLRKEVQGLPANAMNLLDLKEVRMIQPSEK